MSFGGPPESIDSRLGDGWGLSVAIASSRGVSLFSESWEDDSLSESESLTI